MRVIQGHSGGTKLIPHCWITWKSRTCEVSTAITLVPLSICIIVHSGLIAGGMDTKGGRQTVFFTAVNLMTDSQEDKPYDVTKTTIGTVQNQVERILGRSMLYQTLALACSLSGSSSLFPEL